MQLTQASLRGVIPALATPFTKDGSAVDFASFEKLINHVLSNGCSGVVACGSTGEAMTLSDDEYRATIAHASEAVRSFGRGFCIAGIGTSNTARAVQIAKELGTSVDGILLVAPPYNKPSQEGIIEHFRAVKKVARVPIVGYNVPGRTASNILPKTFGVLAAEQCIVGIKESSGSIDQISDLALEVQGRVALLSGDDSLTLPILAIGGVGVVSVTGNVIPGKISALIQATQENRWNDARALHFEMLPLTRALFMESNPAPVKAALALRGIIAHGTVRLPLLSPQSQTMEKLAQLSDI